MKETVINLSDRKIVEYIFKTLPREEENAITDYLIENHEQGEAVHGLIDLCIEKKFDRTQLENHLKSIRTVWDLKKNIRNPRKYRKFTPSLTLAFAILGLVVAIVTITFEIFSYRKVKRLNTEFQLQKDSLLLEIQKLRQDTAAEKGYDSLLKEYQNIEQELNTIASSQQENSALEEQLFAQRSSQFEVISPKFGKIFPRIAKVVFEWEPGIKPARIQIMNNKALVIFSKDNPINRIVLSETLAPGLYYWRLESNRDILFVGKFIINNK